MLDGEVTVPDDRSVSTPVTYRGVRAKADRHLLRHICRTPLAGMLHFLYAFEHRRLPVVSVGKARPAEDAPQPSECQVEGSRWAPALEEQ